jgi:hypothetical protein
MSIKQKNTENYLEKPVAKKTTTEQMIYGGGDTLQETQAKSDKKKEKMLTE